VQLRAPHICHFGTERVVSNRKTNITAAEYHYVPDLQILNSIIKINAITKTSGKI